MCRKVFVGFLAEPDFFWRGCCYKGGQQLKPKIMKKILFLIAIAICTTSIAKAQDWSVGARIGSGFAGVAQAHFGNDTYVEMRLGMSWASNHMGNIDGVAVNSAGGAADLTGDFSALYNWRVLKMNWTPKGEWFLDAGVGLNLGGKQMQSKLSWFYTGVQGMCRLGYTFGNAPVSLAFDWSPAIDVSIISGKTDTYDFGTKAGLNGLALANFGISCVYNF
jgi:hypothetical protein